MPAIRCWHYDELGRPKDGGCPRLGRGCTYVHPSESLWDRAPRSKNPAYVHGSQSQNRPFEWRRSDLFSQPPPTGPRASRVHRDNNEASGSRRYSDSGWANRPRKDSESTLGNNESLRVWKSNQGSSGGTSTWGTAVDETDNTKNVDKGKGRATETDNTSWGTWHSNDNSRWGATGENASEGTSDRWRGEGGWEGISDPSDRTGGWGSVSANEPKEDAWPMAPTESKGDKTEIEDNPEIEKIAEPQSRDNDVVNDTEDTAREGKQSHSPILQDSPSHEEPGEIYESERPQKRQRMSIDDSNDLMDAVKEFEDVQSILSPLPTASEAGKSLADTPEPPVGYIIKVKTIPTPEESSSTPSISLPDNSSSIPKLHDISYKQAREYWNSVIELLSRAIRLKLLQIEVNKDLRDFKSAEHSNIYQKAGNKAASLLESEKRRLKAATDKLGRDYRDTLLKLVFLERQFDFPLYALTQERESVTEMHNETQLLRQFVRGCLFYIESKKQEVDNIVSISRSTPDATSDSNGYYTENPELPSPNDPEPQTEEEMILSRLKKLGDLACDLSYRDLNKGTDLPELVRKRIDEHRPSLMDGVKEMDAFEKEVDEVSKRLAEEHAILDKEVEDLASGVREIFLERERVTVDTEIEIIKRRIDEIRGLLGIQKNNEQTIEALLRTSNSVLQELRERLRPLCVEKNNSDLSDEVTKNVLSVVLSACREKTFADWEEILKQLTEDSKNVIEENEKRIVDKLVPVLLPILNMSNETRLMLQKKVTKLPPHPSTLTSDSPIGTAPPPSDN